MHRIIILIGISFLSTVTNSQVSSTEEIRAFVSKLAFKGPMIAGTTTQLGPEDWVGSVLMYPSTTNYVNWEFAFSWDGQEGMPVMFNIEIYKEVKLIGQKKSFYDFSATSNLDYKDGFGDEHMVWEAGEYHIKWIAEGQLLTSAKFQILEDKLSKTAIVKKALIRDFEVYFLENENSERDYTYYNNYHFPQERVGFIAWRITFNLPYSINTYDLKTEVKIYSQNNEFIDSKTGITSTVELPQFTGKLAWLPKENWPKGAYKMDILVEDRYIVSREFYVE